MPTVVRADLPKGLPAGRPVVPLVLRGERAGGVAVFGSLRVRGDAADRLRLRLGTGDAPALELGNGSVVDLRAYRSAASTLTVDDGAGGAATLAVVGSLTVGGVAVQLVDAELTALAGLTSAADRLPYFTGSGTAALATFTSAGRAILDDASASDQRTTLGLGTFATRNVNSLVDATGLQYGRASLDGYFKVDTNGVNALLVSELTAHASNQAEVRMFVGAESWQRIGLKTTDSSLVLGSGAAAVDLRVRRSAVSTLYIDDMALGPANLTIGGATTTTAEILNYGIMKVERTAAGNNAFESRVVADSVARWVARVDGQLVWSSGAASGDLRAYRSAASTLTVDDLAGTAAATVTVEGGDAVDEGGKIRLNGGSTDDDWSIRAATTDILSFRNESQSYVPMTLNYAASKASNLNLDGFIDITRDTATQAIRTFVTGDTNPRVNITASSTGGKIDLGLGNAATDIHIERAATDRVNFESALGVGFLPMLIRKATDQAITNSSTLTDVTSLTFPVRASTQYSAMWVVAFTVDSATTDGIKFAVNGPVGCLVSYWVEIPTAIAAGTDIITDGQSAVLDTGILTAAIDATGTRHVARITAVIDNGANAGTVALRAAGDAGATVDVTIKAGSWALIA